MARQVQTLRRALATGAVVLTLPLTWPNLAAAYSERAYGGNCSTVIVPVTPAGTFPQELRITSNCTLTHLGRTTATAQQFVTPTGQSGTVVSVVIENTAVYTAANGDQLHTTFNGIGQLDLATGEVTFAGAEAFHGGSGRFSDATGTDRLEGTASIFTNLGSFDVKGRIAY
jgi:hypothetical protein